MIEKLDVSKCLDSIEFIMKKFECDRYAALIIALYFPIYGKVNEIIVN